MSRAYNMYGKQRVSNATVHHFQKARNILGIDEEQVTDLLISRGYLEEMVLDLIGEHSDEHAEKDYMELCEVAAGPKTPLPMDVSEDLEEESARFRSDHHRWSRCGQKTPEEREELGLEPPEETQFYPPVFQPEEAE